MINNKIGIICYIDKIETYINTILYKTLKAQCLQKHGYLVLHNWNSRLILNTGQFNF